MSDDGGLEERVGRLEARVERERSARQEAEAIAERVATERWEQRAALEGKLAERTRELQAAREAATEASAERERILSEVSHSLRTSLAALFFALDSSSADQPLGETRLAEMRKVVEEMRSALDERAFSSSSGRPGRTPPPDDHADGRPPAEEDLTLASLLDRHEDQWQRAAARTGKLLLVDLAPGCGDLPAAEPDLLNDRVLALIHEQSSSPEPMVELRLVPGASGAVSVELAPG